MKKTRSAKKLLSLMLLLIMLVNLVPTAAAAEGTVWEDPVYTVTTIEGGEYQGMFALSVRRYEKGNHDNFVGGAAVSHGEIKVTKEPSCSQYGEALVQGPIVFSSPCEFANSEGPVKAIIPTTSHRGKTTRVKEPTYAEEGILELYCDVCGQTIQYPIARLVPNAPYRIDTKVDVVCDYNKVHKMSLSVPCDRSGEVSLGKDNLYHVTTFANDSEAYFEFEKTYPGHELSSEHSLAAQFHFDATEEKWVQDTVPQVHVSCKEISENTFIKVINAPECPTPIPGEAVYNYTASGTGYSISSSWFKMLSDTDITQKEPVTATEFQPHTRYMLELVIKAEPGYLFPVNAEVNVENYGRLSFVEFSKTQIKSQIIFDETGDKPIKPQLKKINLLSCDFPTEPMLETADYMKVTKGSHYKAAASWEKNGIAVNGPLTEGESYIVHITFTPEPGYIFAETADIIICGGQKVTWASEENGTKLKYNIEYTVPKSEANAAATIERNGKTLSFESLEDAISQAQDGDTISLQDNCIIFWTQSYNFDKNLIFRLNGHKATFMQGFSVGESKSIKFADGGDKGGVTMSPVPTGIVLGNNSKLLLDGTDFMLSSESGNGISAEPGSEISLDGISKLSITSCDSEDSSAIKNVDSGNSGLPAALSVKNGSTLNIAYCNSGIINKWNVDVLGASSLSVSNCKGNGANVSNFNIVDSTAQFTTNASFGISAENLSIDNSSLTADHNAYNGIQVNGSLSVKNYSVVESCFNNCGFRSAEVTPAGIGLNGNGEVIDSSIKITDNTGSGLCQRGSDKSLIIDEDTTLTISGNSIDMLGVGGGLYCEGNVELPGKAVIVNNHAPDAGDDIAVMAGAKLKLGPADKNSSLDGIKGNCKRSIDGWYKDGPCAAPMARSLSNEASAPSFRWNPHSEENFYVEPVESGQINGLMYLKAAHGQMVKHDEIPAVLSFQKLDSQSGKPIQGAVYSLYVDKDCKNVILKYTSDENGKFSVAATGGEFYLKETEAPEGYALSNAVDVLKFTELPAETLTVVDTSIIPNEVELVHTTKYKASWNGTEIAEGQDVILKNTPLSEIKERTISVEKEWDDEGFEKYRSESVKAELLADGAVIKELELNKDNNWKQSVENLPVTDAAGREIVYTVEEKTELPHYTPSVEATPTGFKLVNTLDRSDFTRISIEKRWIDEIDMSHRPDSVKVELLADGKTVAELELNEENEWSAAVDNVPLENEKGGRIEYSVKEVTQSPYYTAKVEEIEPGFRIINTLRTDAFSDVTVRKEWNDKNETKYRSSSVEIALYADGDEVERFNLGKDNDWKFTLHLPRYNSDGSEIRYTVKELTKLDRYSVSYKDGGFTVVNTLTDKPKTGDETRPGEYFALMALSVLGVSAAVSLMKKKKENN